MPCDPAGWELADWDPAGWEFADWELSANGRCVRTVSPPPGVSDSVKLPPIA